MAHVDLAAVVGRAVRRQEDFGATLREGLADAEIAPYVLAYRYADPHAAKIHRARHLTRIEDALFVKFAVVRQVDLVADGDDPATVENRNGIVPEAGGLPRKADDDARPAICRLRRKLLHRLFAGLQESGLQDEVLRRIAGDEEFGQKQQIGAFARRRRPCLACLCNVAGNVSDRRIELCHGDP